MSEDLKQNKNVANLAVKNDGKSIKYFSNELKNNKDIAYKSIENDGFEFIG